MGRGHSHGQCNYYTESVSGRFSENGATQICFFFHKKPKIYVNFRSFNVFWWFYLGRGVGGIKTWKKILLSSIHILFIFLLNFLKDNRQFLNGLELSLARQVVDFVLERKSQRVNKNPFIFRQLIFWGLWVIWTYITQKFIMNV